MKSKVRDQDQTAVFGLLAASPINVLIFSHLTTDAPFVNTRNIAVIVSGVIAASICVSTTVKLIQLFVKKGRTNSLLIGAGISSALGASVFAVLVEVAKRLQQ